MAAIKGYRRSAVSPGVDPGLTTPDVSTGYGYDTLGRLQSVTDNLLAAPNVTTYGYDVSGWEATPRQERQELR